MNITGQLNTVAEEVSYSGGQTTTAAVTITDNNVIYVDSKIDAGGIWSEIDDMKEIDTQMQSDIDNINTEVQKKIEYFGMDVNEDGVLSYIIARSEE